jgi:hypothetical protein
MKFNESELQPALETVSQRLAQFLMVDAPKSALELSEMLIGKGCSQCKKTDEWFVGVQKRIMTTADLSVESQESAQTLVTFMISDYGQIRTDKTNLEEQVRALKADSAALRAAADEIQKHAAPVLEQFDTYSEGQSTENLSASIISMVKRILDNHKTEVEAVQEQLNTQRTEEMTAFDVSGDRFGRTDLKAIIMDTLTRIHEKMSRLEQENSGLGQENRQVRE